MRRLFLPTLLLFSTSCVATEERAGFDADYCPPVASWDPTWSAREDDVARLVNQRRSEGASCGSRSFGPAGALATNIELRCAARNHSRDMAARGFFAHENPDGDDAADRISRSGFDWSAVGENIAQGYTTPAAVMQGWMESAGHCENIMDPRFESIGVGYYEADGEIWTQTFGTGF